MATTLTRVRESALPRLIDRAAGTPLLWLWGALRRRRALPVAPRRFGLMMFETIGDTLLAGTVPASLRSAFPDCELVVFASRGNRGVLPLFQGIARVVDVPLTQPLRALAAIRSEPVDVMIDIGQWPRWYALLCAASRSGFTIGFETPGQARHYAYDAPVSHGRDVHEVVNFQRLLAPIPGVLPVPPAAALRAVAPNPPHSAPAEAATGRASLGQRLSLPVARVAAGSVGGLHLRAAGEGYAILVSGGTGRPGPGHRPGGRVSHRAAGDIGRRHAGLA